MPTNPENNHSSQEKLMSLEVAKQLVESYKALREQLPAADAIYHEAVRQYPELAISEAADHGDAFAAMMEREYGTDELKKETTPEPVPENANAPVETISSEPAEEHPAPEESAVENPVVEPAIEEPAAAAAPVVEEIPEPVAPEQEHPNRARAREVAEKIKHKPFEMKQEDWSFERDPENRKLIDEELKAMREPVAPRGPDDTLIEMPEKAAPTVAETRDAMMKEEFKYEKLPPTKDGEKPLWQEQAKSAYGDINKAEYQRIYDEQGQAAAMKFAIREQASVTKERAKHLTAEQMKRVGAYMGKAGRGLFDFGILAIVLSVNAWKLGKKMYEKAGGGNIIKDMKQNIEDNKKRPKWWSSLKYVVVDPSLTEEGKKVEAEIAKARREREAKNKPTNPTLKKLLDKNKKGPVSEEGKKNQQEDNAKTDKEKKESIENTKKKVLENLLGEPLGEGNKDAVENFKKVKLHDFMVPENQKNLDGQPITVEQYSPAMKNVHAKLMEALRNVAPSRQISYLQGGKTVDEVIDDLIKNNDLK